MDFLDLTSYSPTSETISYPDTYENGCLGDSYVADYAFHPYKNDGFFDTASFWAPQSPLDSDSTISPHPSPTAIMTSPNGWPNLRPTPFGDLGDLTNAFAPTDIKTSTSPCLSPQSLTRRSPSSSPSEHSHSHSRHHSEEDSSAASKPPPRKRGRPRLYRQSTASSDGASASDKCAAAYPQRLPHNQVERKYREGLNMELERLRRAVPTLPQSDTAAVMGAAKPSKAMVLAAAIDYIKKIERERDEAVYQVERLGGSVRMGRIGKA